MWLWYGNACANVLLCLVLLYRGHYTKYRVLFASLIYEVFAFSVLLYTYKAFGTHSYAYGQLFEGKKLGTIAFSFGVIFEGFAWRNRCIRLPQEIYLSLLLAFFLLQKAEYLHISHVVYEGLRYSNLAIVAWWTYCFRKDSPDEQRHFRPQAPRPREGREEAQASPRR